METVTITTRICKTTDNESDSLYALGCAQAIPDKNGVYVTTTTGKSLAVNRCGGTISEPTLIPQAVLPTRKAGATLRLNRQWESRQWESSDGKSAPLVDDDSRFPRTVSVIGEAEESDTVIGIDAKFLYELAQSLGSDNLTLIIDDSESAVHVLPAHGDGPDAADSFGVIIPCSVVNRHVTSTDWKARYNTLAAEYTAAVNSFRD